MNMNMEMNMSDHSGHLMTTLSPHSVHMEGMDDMGDMGGMDMGNDTDMDMGMAMSFYFGLPVSDILFKGWKPVNEWQLFLSCLVLFVATILYEVLKFYRKKLFKDHYSRSRYNVQTNYGTNASGEQQNTVVLASSRKRLSGPHVAQTFLHILQVAVSYTLMLVFMTFNLWLCLSVVLGAGVGYFVFGSRDGLSMETDCCQ